ncbi:MAG TPA: class I mannose-6-phosphate isomerase [Kiritimatiellia bacterium]|nr:class I mannose-6-phosphate isomerase [Kiritimatiellia bacterium]HPS07071.1 class I mannose-6-phosphate isomerase [Kiritimatiellia bacterium]
MSFMFNPYPYDDANAVNRPVLPPETVSAMAVGNAAVMRAILAKLNACADTRGAGCPFVALDGYVGTDWPHLLGLLRNALAAEKIALTVIDIAACYKRSEELETMLSGNLPTDREIDPVLLFGKIFHGDIDDLFDADRLSQQKKRLQERAVKPAGVREVVCFYGCGAACERLQPLYDVILYCDLTPQQVTLRIRAGRVLPLGDRGERTLGYIFRRLYYFDYEIAMKHRDGLILSGAVTFYIDANRPDTLKLLPCDAFTRILAEMLAYPFRCKPVYLEGVWGGQYIKKLRGLPEDMRNCAWVFDLIPNEVSVLIKVGQHTLEVPFPTFFRTQAEQLMGPESVRRFGRLFPIRFNFDDTYAGNGNMSIQVHPPAEYTREHFNEPFQQDESYYVVKTGGSRTYLGFHDDADTKAFFEKVRAAETRRETFDYDRFVNSFESRQGDQFLLPGGTVHASGRNQVVLEIGSCTVGSYTFKLYDYLRLDLNGVPRPIHSRHGQNVTNTACRRSTADGVLRPQPKVLREGPGWREVLLGEHEKIYFSLRRLEFERAVCDDTDGKFHVLVLVEGEEVLVTALDHPERCFRMRPCDMVVVPASLGKYSVINLGCDPCKVTKTLLK